ncbi:unnamed protein product [Symbiodinium sp. CCMP2592]|nr:unnamed protein product [Symbiodinium sp. CCMP2592]
MTEKRFMTYARSEEGGDLTKSQAEKKWEEMWNSRDYVKRGKKIAVPIEEDLVDFSEMARKRAIEGEQRLNANMSEEEMQGKLANLVASGDGSLGAGLSIGSLVDSLAASGGDEGDGAALAAQNIFNQELPLPDLHAMAAGRSASSKQPAASLRRTSFGSNKSGTPASAAASDGSDDGSGSDSDDSEESQPEAPKKKAKLGGKEGQGQPGQGQGGGKQKWFDVGTEKAKAERQVRETRHRSESKMRTQLAAMKAQLDLSRAASVTNVVELHIVISRQQALQIIFNGTADDFKKSGVDARSVRSSGSANEKALLAAGPCSNFKELVTLSGFDGMKLLADARTEADIVLALKQVKAFSQHWDELIASCKTATGELKRATASANRDQGARSQAMGRAKGKAAAKAKATKEGNHAFQIFDILPHFDLCDVDGGPHMDKDHNLSQPWLFTWDVEDLPEDACPLLKLVPLKDAKKNLTETDKPLPSLVEEIEAFERSFKKRDLRLVAGKGQQSCKETTAQAVRTHLLGLFPKNTVCGKDDIDPCLFQNLRKSQALDPAIWGCVKGHRSVKFELGALPCVRFWLQGERSCVCFREEAILEFLRHKQKQASKKGQGSSAEPLFSSHAVAWATHVKRSEFGEYLEFVEKMDTPQVWHTVFQPPAALYLPAGIIVAEFNDEQEDNLGLKVCFAVPRDTAGTAVCRALVGEAKDQGKTIPVLSDLVLYSDTKQKEFVDELLAEKEKEKKEEEEEEEERKKTEEEEKKRIKEAEETEAKEAEKMKQEEEARNKAEEEEKMRIKEAEEAKPKEAEAEDSEEKRKQEQEAGKKAEEEERRNEAEEKRKQEEEAGKKAEEEKKRKEAEEKMKQEEEARQKAEEEEKKRIKEAEEFKAKEAEEEEKMRIKEAEEAKAKEAEEKKKQEEEEARQKAEEEEKNRIKEAEEAKAKEAEAKRKQEEEEARQKAEEEEKKRIKEAEEAKAKEAEAKRKQEEEAGKKAEEEKKRKEAEEARAKEAKAKRKQEEEAGKKAEEEKKRKEAEEARAKEAEAKRKQEEEAGKKAEEEEKKRKEAEEAKAKAKEAEAKAKRKQEEEARKKAEEEEKKRKEAKKQGDQSKKTEDLKRKAATPK